MENLFLPGDFHLFFAHFAVVVSDSLFGKFL